MFIHKPTAPTLKPQHKPQHKPHISQTYCSPTIALHNMLVTTPTTIKPLLFITLCPKARLFQPHTPISTLLRTPLLITIIYDSLNTITRILLHLYHYNYAFRIYFPLNL